MKWKNFAICLFGYMMSNEVIAKPKSSQVNQDDFDWAKQLFNKKGAKTYIDRDGKQVACPACECGKPYEGNKYVRPANYSQRIVQGQEAFPFYYPWITWITFYTVNGIRVCGGSVINDLYIATASHCILSIPQNVTVSLMRHDLHSTRGSMDRKVVQIIMHENYAVAAKFDFDIALLKLDRKVDLSENQQETPLRVRPICLPSAASDFHGQVGTAAGWGWVTPNAPISQTLQEVQLPIVSDQECGLVWGNALTQNMICAGYSNSGKITCFGDSGGPLHYWDGNKFQLAGIVSWGWTKCGDPRRYGVFAKVTNFIDWIVQHTADACYCN